VSNGVQVKTATALAAPVSVDWCRYRQRAVKKAAAVVSVVWTGSGKNKLRLVAG
jgi:hypothetical protein